MRKKLFLFILACLTSVGAQSQTSISFFSGTASSGEINLEFIGGETLSGQFSGSSISLFSGFYSVTPSFLVSNDAEESLPISFKLNQNYPNPFNPSTIISYSVPQTSTVQIDVFNTIGSRVASLDEGKKTAGSYTRAFQADHLASGMYIYTLVIDGSPMFSNKMILIK